MDKTDLEETGFYVEPKRDCPHMRSSQHYAPETHAIAANAPCEVCEHDVENWACLKCNKRFCSRYVKGHMKAHSEETGHLLCVSYSDLSFWCYGCDSYVTSPAFAPLLRLMSAAKFGDAGTGGRYTAHANLEQMEEREDSPEALEEKIKQLADIVRNSKHLVVFTGAGISTSAGIPDYRGPQGEWTLRAKGEHRTQPTVPLLKAAPTPCHMALVELQRRGSLKHVISQNVDGLHRRSGIPPSCLSELHGNSNLETCERCGREYMRDFGCSGSVGHSTGRSCTAPSCRGRLLDSIIHFGEQLKPAIISKAFAESEKADVCIVLGSSLTVTPAADCARMVGKKDGGKLVIVNLQRTPLDRLSALRIFGRSDQVMRGLMGELGLEVPPFVLKRGLLLGHREGEVTLEGLDADGSPMTLFKKVTAKFAKSGRKEVTRASKYDVPSSFSAAYEGDEGEEVKLKLEFFGHYNEPDLVLSYAAKGEACVKRYNLEFRPDQGEWTCEETALTGDEGTSSASQSSSSASNNGRHDDEEEAKGSFPATATFDGHQHDLCLAKDMYPGGVYRCDACLKVGSGWAYHCDMCHYDLHPACCRPHEK